jgi:hypothetical protein
LLFIQAGVNWGGHVIVVRLMGGLGNQMFQYACAKSLALRYKTDVRVDLSYLLDEELRSQHTPREFELGCFVLSQRLATPSDLAFFNRGKRGFARLIQRLRPRVVLQERTLRYDPDLLAGAKKNTQLIGYWQSEAYFASIRSTLLSDFRLARPLSYRATEMAVNIRATIAVSLHVRRGDYATLPEVTSYHGICGQTYYRKAVQYMKSKVPDARFFVFSDDPAWCRQSLEGSGAMTIVEPSDSAAEDMYLMSLCRHHIVTNSSFSWWGAWLNLRSDKVVIAPKLWISPIAPVQPDIIPPDWLVMHE